MLLQSSKQDSSLEDDKVKKEDRPSSSHLSTYSGKNPDKEEPSDDLSKPKKVHYYSKSKNSQDAVYWINSARAQDKGLRFWQTRSHAVIVYSSVSADCIYKVISQKEERTLFERLSTPRPAPKTVLESAWQSKQQQQQQQEHIRECVFQHQENWCRERNKVNQYKTQNHLASGN